MQIDIDIGKKIKKLHHCVYVIELDGSVFEEKKFREKNPHYKNEKPCVYVGMTGLSPDQRFLNHKAGKKSSKYPNLYGLRLLPELYEYLNPMTYEQAHSREEGLAAALKGSGYAVWQA